MRLRFCDFFSNNKTFSIQYLHLISHDKNTNSETRPLLTNTILKTSKLDHLRYINHVMRTVANYSNQKALLDQSADQSRRVSARMRFLYNLNANLNRVGERASRRR